MFRFIALTVLLLSARLVLVRCLEGRGSGSAPRTCLGAVPAGRPGGGTAAVGWPPPGGPPPPPGPPAGGGGGGGGGRGAIPEG